MLRYSPCTTAWSGFVTVKHIIFLLKKVNRASLLTGWIWLLLRQVHTYSIFAICHPNANSCNTSVVQQSHVCALYLDRTSNLRYLNLLYLIIILSRWCNSTFPVVGFDVRGKKPPRLFSSLVVVEAHTQAHTHVHTTGISVGQAIILSGSFKVICHIFGRSARKWTPFPANSCRYVRFR